jgi:hypothetical protein
MSRAQCTTLARAGGEAATQPSYVVKTEEDCVKAASRESCEAMYAAQQAAQKDSGPSVDAERCLEEESKERCEAQLGPQLEAQYRAEG